MSQITNHRRGRAIRRGLAVILILVVGPAAYLVYDLTRDRTPEVRTAVLSNGPITSVMTITTSIRPGSIQETRINQQLGKEVLVQPGDQVRRGDPLMTFDLTGLREQLQSATELRQQTESAAAEVNRLAATQATEAQKSVQNLQTQVNRLSAGLTGSVQSVSRLSATAPNTVTVDESLIDTIVQQLAAIDLSAPDAAAQIRQLLVLLTGSIQVTANPDYETQLAA